MREIAGQLDGLGQMQADGWAQVQGGTAAHQLGTYLELFEREELPEPAALVGTDRATIVTAANELLDDAAAYSAMAKVESPYGDGRAAHRIAELCGAFVNA